jgi:hypothetical protein
MVTSDLSALEHLMFTIIIDIISSKIFGAKPFVRNTGTGTGNSKTQQANVSS